MRLQCKKGTGNIIKSSSDRLTAHLGVPLVIAILIFSALFATAVQATTLLDPKPEPSTTYFGFSIAVVGDVDGDGVPDLAVGAPFQDGDVAVGPFGPPQDVGKVWLISGANLGVIRELNDPAFQPPAPPDLPKFGGFFGFSVAGVGDLNHDGITDVLVGTPHHSNFVADRINCGEAFVFSGADSSILFTINDPNEEEGNRFGYAVASLGDVNGDGVPDMVIGVPKKDASEDEPDVGTAYIFSGANGSLIREVASPDQTANSRFGSAVANAGDVDHDGVNDILIGEPGASKVYVFSGATGALIFTMISPASSNADKLPSFGSAVAGGKDLDGDGTPDFVIGAPLQSGLKGAAYVFKGSNGTLLRSLRGPRQAFGKFGSSVALSADVTGDGRPDILVGAPDVTVNSLLNAGEVLIFRGNNEKLFRTVTSQDVDGPKLGAGFGYAVTTADFNGTGTPEVVVGVPYEDKDILVNGDVETHLQIGMIETQAIQ